MTRDYNVILVILLAALVMIATDVWAWHNGTLIAYGDAASHLAISRRVVDNITPGFGQLGSSWLPLLHLLMLPFIWIDPLWQTGLAGTIVSNAAYIAAGAYCYWLARALTEHKGISLAATLLLFANPNLTYMSVTAMNETLFVFTVIASTTHLLWWSRQPKKYIHLIAASMFGFLTAFNRYEGWFFVIGQAVAVYLVSWKRLGKKYALGATIVFAYVAWAAPALWLGWNFLIFDDPFNFLHDDYTSRGQQLGLELEGRLPTKGNIIVSSEYFYRSMVHILGLAPTVLAIITILLLLLLLPFMLKRTGDGHDPYSDIIIGCTLTIPGFFLIYTLVKGVTALHLPEVAPYDIYNIRYGLFVFPALVFFVIYALRLSYRAWKPLAITVIASLFIGVSLVWVFPWMALEEGLQNLGNNQKRAEAIEVLHGNYKGGKILINASQTTAEGRLLISVGAGAGNTFMLHSGLPMKSFVHEGTQEYWESALNDPADNVEWIIMNNAGNEKNSRDKVANRLLDNPKLLEPYKLMYKDGGLEMYRLKK